jgi:hypothetical protein
MAAFAKSTVGDMVRVASRLGLCRRAKDIGPTLADYLAEDQEAQRAEQREQHEVQQHE